MKDRLNTFVTDSKVKLYLDSTIYNLGITQDRSTSSSFTSLTAMIILYRPIYVHHITWDVRIAGTYRLAFIGHPNTDNTEYKVVVASKVIGAGASNIVFTPDAGPFFLRGGKYQLKLSTSPAVRWWDGPAFSDLTYGIFQIPTGVYNTTTSNYPPPVHFVFQPVLCSGLLVDNKPLGITV